MEFFRSNFDYCALHFSHFFFFFESIQKLAASNVSVIKPNSTHNFFLSHHSEQPDFRVNNSTNGIVALMVGAIVMLLQTPLSLLSYTCSSKNTKYCNNIANERMKKEKENENNKN